LEFRRVLFRSRVGGEVHVGLFDPGNPLDGGAVEHDLVVQRPLQLAAGDGHVLDDPHDVAELQANEADTPLVCFPEDLLFGHGIARPPGALRPANSPAGLPENALWVNYRDDGTVIQEIRVRKADISLT